MTRSVRNFYSTDETGAIIPLAEISVNFAGGAEAPIYTVNSGGTPVTQPLISTSSGKAVFYIEPGVYDIESKDPISLTTSTFSNEEVGTSRADLSNNTDIDYEFATTEDLINNVFDTPPEIGSIADSKGFGDKGDSGKGSWNCIENTGAGMASQSPSQLGGALLNDGNGNQWELVVDGYINALSLGVKRDGTDSFLALTALKARWNANPQSEKAQEPKPSERAIYFPSGKYVSSADIEFITNDTGQSIFGDGASSNLHDNIRLTVNSYRCSFRDMMISGAGITGVVLSDTTLEFFQKSAVISNLWIRDRDTNLTLGKGAWGKIDNINTEKAAIDNILLSKGSGYPLSNVNANAAVRDNWVIKDTGNGAGEFKLVNCIGINAGRYNLRIEGTDADNTVENYFTQCTFTNALRTRLLDISSIVDIDGSNVKVTFTDDHLLFDGQSDVRFTDTTSYNGTFVVTYISDTEVSISATYVSDEFAGEVNMRNWDVFIDVPNPADSIHVTNDMFFIGGNINYLYIKRGYSINFTGTRLKSQIQLGEVNRVMFMRQGRGRVGNAFNDVPVNGSNTGWADIAYKDPTGSISPGGGRMAISAPDNTVASNNGTATLHALEVTETGITATGFNVGGFFDTSREFERIVSGEITAISTNMATDNEADAATDDLDTINGGVDGRVIIISTTSSTRTTTVRNNTGNIRLNNNTNVLLIAGPRSRLMLQYDSRVNQWIQMAPESNA